MDTVDKAQYVLTGVCFECKQQLSAHKLSCRQRPAPRQIELPLWDIQVKKNQA